jgi:hypothetical protein
MERRKDEFRDESEELEKEFKEFLSSRHYLSSYEIRELFERREELFKSPSYWFRIILEIKHDDEI